MKNRITNLLLIILISFVFCDIAISEEYTIEEFLDDYDKGDEIFNEIAIYRFDAASDAFGWANSQLTKEGRQLFYCQPDQLAITGTQAFRIFRDQVVVEPYVKKMGTNVINLILFRGLQRVFPCE